MNNRYKPGIQVLRLLSLVIFALFIWNSVAQAKGFLVLIDPGHGGVDPGAIGFHNTTEAEINLEVALILKQLLDQRGFNTQLTRVDNSTSISLSDRAKLVHTLNADLFISIHHNATASENRFLFNRSEIYIPLSDNGLSYNLGYLTVQKLTRLIKPQQITLDPANYRVIRNNFKPSILTEADYLSNPLSEKQLNNKKYLELQARAYAEAISDYFDYYHCPIKFLYQDPSNLVFHYQTGSIYNPRKISIQIEINGIPAINCVEENNQIIVPIPDQLSRGEHEYQLIIYYHQLVVGQLRGKFFNYFETPNLKLQKPRANYPQYFISLDPELSKLRRRDLNDYLFSKLTLDKDNVLALFNPGTPLKNDNSFLRNLELNPYLSVKPLDMIICRRANQSEASIFIHIVPGTIPQIQHYHNSSGGKKLAAEIAAGIDSVKFDVGPGFDYKLTNTNAIALIITLPDSPNRRLLLELAEVLIKYSPSPAP